MIQSTEYVGELIFEPTFHSRERVFSIVLLEHPVFIVATNLVVLQRTRDAPMSLSLIRPFRLTAVWRVMKPDISIIALLQIVAVLVCPFVFFL